MSDQTYTAKDMRDAFIAGGAWWANTTWGDYSTPSAVVVEALRRYPDPKPVLSVREERDSTGFGWRIRNGVIEYAFALLSMWKPACEGAAWEINPERIVLWADLLAYSWRLPDGTPCDAEGNPRPSTKGET